MATKEKGREYDKARSGTPKRKASHLVASRKWTLANIEQARMASRDSARRYRIETLSLLAVNGVISCLRCGFSDVRAIQIDHVNGGGNKMRNKHRNQTGLRTAVRENPELFQLLCANCNCIKRIENNELHTGLRATQKLKLGKIASP